MPKHETRLHGTWELRDELLTCPLTEAGRLSRVRDGWIDTPVPGDIHQGLIAAGRINDPLVGLNSFDCRWTEDRSWWFRKRFEIDASFLESEVIELEMNGLDAGAEIFLNGGHIGSHRNAFRPFVLDVKPWLEPGENVLLVRLSTGVEGVSDADMDAPDGVRAGTEAGNGRPERGDPRRALVRKPQYSFGWDWSPRVATTAIAGDVVLRGMSGACIRNVALRPRRDGTDGGVVVEATVAVERFHYYATAEAALAVSLTDPVGREFRGRTRVLLRSGLTFARIDIPVPGAKLWWPNGLGEQPLYRVSASLDAGEDSDTYPAFDFGTRFVELDTDGRFAFVVNGERVFSKGANWIPPDTIYARATAERYDSLVREARDANFNMLRIWGGGRYEHDAFFEACDRYGIMVWHDFMFSCAPYPDHLEWFRDEVRREAEHQTRRLQPHACIVLWSGSNENNWGFRDWWQERTRGGALCYNYILPGVVERNCPEIPYWNGSPYGGDAPNCCEIGDRHHWGDCMMNPDMQKRITPEEYDTCTSLFVSEFGYIGAPCRETVVAYLDEAEPDRQGKAWQHHTNTFEKNTVEAGIRKHYVDPEALTLDQYLLYSGLCQGLMYAYALESMRLREACHGSLFWMYNDCWGEVGWTIIDSYLRRKPSWYFVRRAYAPLRLILRADDDTVRVVLANDTAEQADFELEVGYVSLDGTEEHLRCVAAAAPPLSRTDLCTFPRGTHDPAAGLWVARARNRPDISPAHLRVLDYRQLRVCNPGLFSETTPNDDGTCTVRVRSRAYAHAVRILLPDRALPSDNYFDLLPGEEREVRVAGGESLSPQEISVTCLNAARP